MRTRKYRNPPPGFARVESTEHLKKLRAARVQVWPASESAYPVWAPAWAAHAPADATTSQLRQAKRDPAMQAALIAAARLSAPARTNFEGQLPNPVPFVLTPQPDPARRAEEPAHTVTVEAP